MAEITFLDFRSMRRAAETGFAPYVMLREDLTSFFVLKSPGNFDRVFRANCPMELICVWTTGNKFSIGSVVEVQDIASICSPSSVLSRGTQEEADIALDSLLSAPYLHPAHSARATYSITRDQYTSLSHRRYDSGAFSREYSDIYVSSGTGEEFVVEARHFVPFQHPFNPTMFELEAEEKVEEGKLVVNFLKGKPNIPMTTEEGF